MAKDLTTSWMNRKPSGPSHSNKRKKLKIFNLDSGRTHLRKSKEQDEAYRVNSNINLTLEDRKLVAVIGRVGSGKSSLLASLLGETHVQSGSLY